MTTVEVVPAEVDPDRPAPSATAAHALRILVTGLLVAVPVVFDPRVTHAGGRPKYVVVLAGAAAAGTLLFACRRPLAGNWLRWPVLGLLGCTAASALASDHRPTALHGFAGSYDGLWAAVALAIVFSATVAAFASVPQVRRAVALMWFGAGTAVLVFGLAQVVDRMVSPGGWDWSRPSVAPSTIGSTLGNPNHVAAFLATLLPLGVVLAVLGDRRTRVAVAAGGVVLVAELGITASRGGLAAAVSSMAVLAGLLRRELRAHRSLLFGVAAGAAALALAAGIAAGATGTAKRDLGAMATAGPGSTVDLRLQVWRTALRVAADHPVTGVGPDVFPVAFPGYADERFRETYGPFTVANGAHNLFLNTLANLGGVGLAALLVVLGTAGVRIVRAVGTGVVGTGDELAREHRLLLGGIGAALVAYVVQACFNTQDVALSFCFWVLLGLAVSLVPARPVPGPAPGPA